MRKNAGFRAGFHCFRTLLSCFGLFFQGFSQFLARLDHLAVRVLQVLDYPRLMSIQRRGFRINFGISSPGKADNNQRIVSTKLMRSTAGLLPKKWSMCYESL